MTARPGTDAREPYDRAYFEKWYRNPRHRVKSAAELARQAAFVVHTAEWVLGRRIRTVLDVGCGEGNWRPVLRRLRPRVHYTGIDPSDYAVKRWGRRRGIRAGNLGSLDECVGDRAFDLVLCVGMLNYVAPAELRRGLAALQAHADGLVYLEIFTGDDDGVTGDVGREPMRPAAWYRRMIRRAGLVSLGLHCYVPDWLAANTAVLERAT